jgi:hypothetical protein
MTGISLPLVILAVVSMRYQVGDAVPLGMVGALFAAAAFAHGTAVPERVHRGTAGNYGSRWRAATAGHGQCGSSIHL